jgi:hypothetical protein
MKQFKIVPLSEEYADKIRETRKDDFGMLSQSKSPVAKAPAGFFFKTV